MFTYSKQTWHDEFARAGMLFLLLLLIRADAIFGMLGRHAAPAVDDQTASKHVDKIFHVGGIFLIFLHIILLEIEDKGLNSLFRECATRKEH